MAQSKHAGCAKCIELKVSFHIYVGVVKILDEDILEELENAGKKAKKDERNRKAQLFLQNVSALLNNGSGILIVHVENPFKLDTFEQCVCQQMAALIPDNSPFYENFERHIVGNNHLIFRVIPREGRQLSTLSFNTKIPQSCNVVEPTAGQMRYLLERKEGNAESELYKQLDFTFREDQLVEVKVKRIEGSSMVGQPVESVFQESMTIQAKRVPKKQRRGLFRDYMEPIFFDKDLATYVPKYVAAFTKLHHGGSIFLGIKEDKEESPKWDKVEGRKRDELLTLREPLSLFHLWKDKDEDKLYHIAEDSQKTERDSGQYKCEGVKLTCREHEDLPDRIKRLLLENMYWHPYGQQTAGFLPPVNVNFHPVEGTKDMFVVEIVVTRYEGMAFHDKDGPTAYNFQTCFEDDSCELKILSKEEWFEMFLK